MRINDGSSGYRGRRCHISCRKYPFGMVPLLGKEVSAKEIFAKLRESGVELPNELDYLRLIEAYLGALGEFNIGNIVRVVPWREIPYRFPVWLICHPCNERVDCHRTSTGDIIRIAG